MAEVDAGKSAPYESEKSDPENNDFGSSHDSRDKRSIRAKAARVLNSVRFELTLGCVVCFNIGLVVMEVNAQAAEEDVPAWVSKANNVLLMIYVAEIMARFVIMGLPILKSPYCLLDITLVSVDLITGVWELPVNSSILRVARLGKISRTFKMMKAFPELNTMLKGLIGAGKAIFWGAVLASLMVLIWSILAVTLIHPINRQIAEETSTYDGCLRCPHAYSTVFRAALTFTQQIIAGDSWGQVTVPVVEKAPWTALFFFGVFASLALATMNLILALICDSSQQARQMTEGELAKEKEKSYAKARKRLAEICKDLDADQNGKLSLEELQGGMANNPEFSDVLCVLDIKEEDMPIIFGVMDHDGVGEVGYEDFVRELWKMQTNDVQSMVIHIRFYVNQIRTQLMERLASITEHILKEEEIMLKGEEELAKSLSKIEVNEAHLEENLARSSVALGNDEAGFRKSFLSLGTPLPNLPQEGDASSAEILAKLECIGQAQEQALSSLATSIRELTSQIQQNGIDETLVKLKPTFEPQQSLKPSQTLHKTEPMTSQTLQVTSLHPSSSLFQEEEALIAVPPNSSWSKGKSPMVPQPLTQPVANCMWL